MTGPSITGSENGIPISIASRSGVRDRSQDVEPVAAETTGDVGHEQLVTPVASSPEGRLERPE